MVRTVGLEPTRDCSQGILSPLRLPFRHVRVCGFQRVPNELIQKAPPPPGPLGNRTYGAELIRASPPRPPPPHRLWPASP
jgi:hypothetical protein